MGRAWRRWAVVCGLGMAVLWGSAAVRARRTAAATDWLTGAGDRAAFRRALERKRPVRGLVLAKLWGMEQVNQIRGYRAGDEIIARAAESLRLVCGDGSDLYRIGGCTFVAVLPGGNGPAPDRAAARSARIYGAGQAGERLMVSWAAGPGTVQRLFRQADIRLRQAR